MPIRGKLKTGPRYNFLNLKFWKSFMKETGIDISYKSFMSVIDASNKKLRDKLLNNTEGFKLPEQLGYMAISRYKAKPGVRKIDFAKTQQTGQTVYFTNFHSFGYDTKVQWYTYQIAQCRNVELYKFLPDKEFQKLKSEKMFAGKIYNEFLYDHFKLKKIKIRLNKLFKND